MGSGTQGARHRGCQTSANLVADLIQTPDRCENSSPAKKRSTCRNLGRCSTTPVRDCFVAPIKTIVAPRQKVKHGG